MMIWLTKFNFVEIEKLIGFYKNVLLLFGQMIQKGHMYINVISIKQFQNLTLNTVNHGQH